MSNVVENLCMRPNIGPAAAGPAGPVATALRQSDTYQASWGLQCAPKGQPWDHFALYTSIICSIVIVSSNIFMLMTRNNTLTACRPEEVNVTTRQYLSSCHIVLGGVLYIRPSAAELWQKWYSSVRVIMLHVFPVTLQETRARLQETSATLNETRATLHASASVEYTKPSYCNKVMTTTIMMNLCYLNNW